MSDQNTASETTSESGASIIGQPFKTAVDGSPSEQPVVKEHVKPTEVTIGVTATPKGDVKLDDYKLEKGNISKQYFDTDTPLAYLPDDVKQNLDVIDKYVEMEIGDRGLKHTISSFDKIITEIMYDMQDPEMNLAEQIDVFAGYARNMIKLSQLPEVKAKLIHVIKHKKSSKDMDTAVLRAIGKLII